MRRCAPRAGSPRPGDDGVEAAVPLERGVDDGAVPVSRRQVGVLDVHAVYGPAISFETLDDRASDRAARAGHQRDALRHGAGPQRTTEAAHA